MSTEKEPDFAAIARKLAQDAFPVEKHPDLLNRNVGYYHAEIKHLRSDWETIRLLRNYRRMLEVVFTYPSAITEVDAHLSKLLESFTP